MSKKEKIAVAVSVDLYNRISSAAPIRSQSEKTPSTNIFTESSCNSIHKWQLDTDEWASVEPFEGNNEILPADMQCHLESWVKLEEFLCHHKVPEPGTKAKPAKPGKPKAVVATEFKDSETDEEGNPLPRIKISEAVDLVDPYSHSTDERSVGSHVTEDSDSSESTISPYIASIYSAITFVSSKAQYFIEEKSEIDEDCCFLWKSIYPKTSTLVSCYNPKGKYCVKLFYGGSWRTIKIDDKIPLNNHGKCMLLQSSSKLEIWPILLSKALMSLLSTIGVFKTHKKADSVRLAAVLCISALTGWPCDPISAEVPIEARNQDESNPLPPLVLQTNKFLIRLLGGQTPVYLLDDEGGDITSGFPKPLPSRTSGTETEKAKLEPRRERKLREQRESTALDQRSGVREKTIDDVNHDVSLCRKSLFVMLEQPEIHAMKKPSGSVARSMSMSSESSFYDNQSTDDLQTLAPTECPYKLCSIIAVRVKKEYLVTINSLNQAITSPQAEILLQWKSTVQQSESGKPLPRQVEAKWTPIRRLMQFVSRGGCIAEFCTLKDLKYSSTIHYHHDIELAADDGGVLLDERGLQPSSVLIDCSSTSSACQSNSFLGTRLHENKESVSRLVLCIWRDRSTFRPPVVNLQDSDDYVSLIEEYPSTTSRPSVECLTGNESCIKLTPINENDFHVNWFNKAMIPSNMIVPIPLHNSFPCSFVSFDIPLTASPQRYFKVKIKSSSGVCVTMLSDRKIVAGSSCDILEQMENASVHRHGTIASLVENLEVPIMVQELKRISALKPWIVLSIFHTDTQQESSIFRLRVTRKSDLVTVYDGPANAQIAFNEANDESLFATLTYLLPSMSQLTCSTIAWHWDLSSSLALDAGCKCGNFSNLQLYEGFYTPNKYQRILKETITLPSTVPDNASMLWVRLVLKGDRGLYFDSSLQSVSKQVLSSIVRSKNITLHSILVQPSSDSRTLLLDACLNQHQKLEPSWTCRNPFPTKKTADLSINQCELPIVWQLQVSYAPLILGEPTSLASEAILLRADTSSLEELTRLHESWEKAVPGRLQCGQALQKLIGSNRYNTCVVEAPVQVEQSAKKLARLPSQAKLKTSEPELSELLDSTDPCVVRASVQWLAEGKSRDLNDWIAEERKRQSSRMASLSGRNLDDFDYASFSMLSDDVEAMKVESGSSAQEFVESIAAELQMTTTKSLEEREKLRQQLLLNFPSRT